MLDPKLMDSMMKMMDPAIMMPWMTAMTDPKMMNAMMGMMDPKMWMPFMTAMTDPKMMNAMMQMASPEMMNQWMGMMTNPQMMDAMMKMMNPALMVQMMNAMSMAMNAMPKNDQRHEQGGRSTKTTAKAAGGRQVRRQGHRRDGQGRRQGERRDGQEGKAGDAQGRRGCGCKDAEEVSMAPPSREGLASRPSGLFGGRSHAEEHLLGNSQQRCCAPVSQPSLPRPRMRASNATANPASFPSQSLQGTPHALQHPDAAHAAEGRRSPNTMRDRSARRRGPTSSPA
jgi:hypothetical protein